MEANEPRFILKSMILIESHFKRIPKVVFDESEVAQCNFDVQTKTEEENKVVTVLTVKLTSNNKEILQFEATVTMVGIFEGVNVSKDILENFGRINAPSIMYPYVREHISSLSVKAGLKTIVLPIVNFVELAKQAKTNTVNN